MTASPVPPPRSVPGVNPRRTVALVPAVAQRRGPVLYWMHRELRGTDNWGLLHARSEAARLGAPLGAVFALDPTYPGATWRSFGFLLAGLAETEAELIERGVPLHVLPCGPDLPPPDAVVELARTLGAALVVTDFDPLRAKRRWTERAAAALRALGVGLTEVDGRNLIPCRAASDRREWMARTLRPKLHRLLPEFLEPFPTVAPQTERAARSVAPERRPDFAALTAEVRTACAARGDGPAAGDGGGPRSGSLDLPPDFPPGPAAARAALERFLAEGLPRYAERANDPNAGAVSRLSPYLHFGQLSAQRAALAVAAAENADAASRERFLEQLVVRRELAENFVWHTPDYDAPSAWPDWARRTLDEHRDDPREYVYDHAAFEAAATHDPLWNAAQREMLTTGHMHGYLRMYWAKKILEWSATPEDALVTALALNDRYELDGRDPNGYAGVAWSLGGLHDQGWKERPVYGKIRYMNARGAARKFDVAAYVARFGG